MRHSVATRLIRSSMITILKRISEKGTAAFSREISRFQRADFHGLQPRFDAGQCVVKLALLDRFVEHVPAFTTEVRGKILAESFAHQRERSAAAAHSVE